MSGTTTPARARRRPSRGARLAYGALGVLGELLITLGVLVLAFLVWQLWWTDVEGNRQQAEVVRELPRVAVPTPTAGAGPLVATPRRDDPPVMADVEYRTTFATIQVPRWDGEPERPVSEGTDRPGVLDVLGVGHYPGTAMPGDVGNFALAAHRTTFAKPFNRIAELQEGDAVVVRTATVDGGPGTDTWYVYRVTSWEIVRPYQTEVIAPVPGRPGEAPTERYITLTTCHPMFSARERYIVHGVLDYWAPVADGIPAELVEGAR